MFRMFSVVMVVLATLLFTVQAHSTCADIEAAVDYFKSWCIPVNDPCTPGNEHSSAWIEIRSGNAYGVPQLICAIQGCNGPIGQLGAVNIVDSSCDSGLESTTSANPPGMCSPTQSGSIIRPESQALSEVIKLPFSSFDLVYSSDRVIGNTATYTIRSKVTGAQVRPSATGVNVSVLNEAFNLVDSDSYNMDPSQYHTYQWDGLNDNNVETWGSLNYRVHLVETGTNITIKNIANVGTLKVKKLGLGGWAPTNWAFYDMYSQQLYLGDGSRRKAVHTRSINLYTSISDEEGDKIYQFDNLGRIFRTLTGKTGEVLAEFSYNGSGQLSEIEEAHGLTTTFNYSSGELVSITDAYSNTFPVTLDANGYLEAITLPGSTVYEMTYSSGGLLETFEKPNGAIGTFTYQNGLLISDEHSGGYESTIEEVAPVGTARSFAFTTKMGRETNYYGSGDEVTRITTLPTGEQTYFSSYDAAYSITNNNVIRSGVTALRHDLKSVKLLTTSYVQKTNTYVVYNQTNVFDPPRNILSDPLDFNTLTTTSTNGTINNETIYDLGDREYNTTTAEGRTSRRKTDDYERTIEEQVGSLTQIDYTYTGKNLTGITQGARSTVLAYNGVGLLSSVTNDLSQTTSYTYDGLGRLDKVILPDLREIDYDYDSVGRLAGVTPEGRSAHVFNFNSSELLEEYAPPLVTGVPNVTTDYAYNDDNQLTLISRPDGKTIEYSYGNTNGLLTAVEISTGVTSYGYASNSSRINWIYPPNGLKQTFTYNGDEISGELVYSPLWSIVSNYSKSWNYSYGDVYSDTVAGGTGTVTVVYGYDDDRVLNVAGNLSLTYNTPNGTLTSTDHGLADDVYGYNSFGEITSYDAKYNSVDKYTLDFVRDDLGRITEKTEMIDGTTSVYEYTYDSTGRLTQVEKNSSVVSTYVYDDNNNRTGGSVYATSTAATYDTQDRMTDYNVFDYTYNANGDLETKTNTLTTQVWEYAYDEFGNLLSVELPNSDIISYEVDGLNRRVARKLNGTVTRKYVYADNLRIIGELDDTNALIRRYVYASKANIPDYFIEGGNEYRIYSDHLGSPRVIVKVSDGTIMQKMEHDEFGRVVADTNPGYTPFGFAGGLYDVDTGLVRFGARDYDPMTGRWTSKDPIRFDGDGPNLFGYVENDPINWVDRSGLGKEAGAGGGAGGPGGGGGTIYVTPGGTAIRAPPGSTTSTANNGQGLVIRPPGSTGNSNTIRVMDPGYVRIYNGNGQPVGPNGLPGPNNLTHIPLDYKGPIKFPSCE